MGYSQAGVVAAQQVVSHHLPSLDGERCSACGDAFPCAFRRHADDTLNAYGLLPRRLPGAALRAAGVPVHNEQPAERKRFWATRNQRGWFDAVINPAVGRAQVPSYFRASGEG
ncbi:hypothetical protein [Dactylosporangium sp. CS-033363]|uniref:hypothetical protein n=1 Tax=Dactylosporangium sp. CS-033363 TaxID=3239935 RepID=UPI003D92F692